MTEGKFKKRVWELSEKKDTKELDGSVNEQKGKVLIPIPPATRAYYWEDDVFEIIDEAKREYLQKGYYQATMTDEKASETLGRAPCVFFIPLTDEEWVTRWFGDEK